MSLLSSFLISHLIPALESAFVAHEPAAQAALLAEVEAFGSQLGSWLSTKVAAAAASSTDASSAASAAEAPVAE